MADHIDAERAALLPCPFCGGMAMYDNEHDDRLNAAIECETCGANVGANILAEGVARWNRRTPSASIGEDGLPELPEQPEELRARWRCEDCGGIGHGGEAHWQGHFQPPEPAICGTCNGAGWVECEALLPEQTTAYALEAVAADRQARASQQKPVAWLEAEPSARGRPVHEVILGMIYSSRIHTKCAPVTSNPVWPLYAAPPLSSEQQAEKGEK